MCVCVPVRPSVRPSNQEWSPEASRSINRKEKGCHDEDNVVTLTNIVPSGAEDGPPTPTPTILDTSRWDMFIYYMTREISSANIQRYYTVQQLIAQLSSVSGETAVKRGRINDGKLILTLIYLCNCHIINNVLQLYFYESDVFCTSVK